MKLFRNLITLFFFLFYLVATGQTNQCALFQDYTIVVLGSSTAAGAGVSHPDSSWVNRYRTYLQNINPDNEVINLAVGGYNTYKIMPTGFTPPTGRPDTDTTRNITAAISYNPNAIIINMPSNDVGSGYSIEEQLYNLDSIVQLSEQNNIPIWVCTTQPRNFTDSMRQVQADIRDSIYLYFSPHTIDFWTNIALPDHSIDPFYDSGDGVHLNDMGHNTLFQKVIDSDILNEIYVSISHIDFSVLDINCLSTNPCGDQNTEFEVIIANTGILDTNITNIYFELNHAQSGSIFIDSISLPNGMDTCEVDTIYFYADTYTQGNYNAECIINNQSDTSSNNDSIQYSIYSSGHPGLIVRNDTLCNPGNAILEAIAEPGDTIYWYNGPMNINPVAYGSIFTTPLINTTTNFYAEAVRGNLFYTNSVFTTSNSNINWNGTMFNLVAHENLIVDSFDVKINTMGNQDIEVYYKTGSYQGFELNSIAWTHAGTVNVNVINSDQFTHIPIGNLSIPANDTLGIYIQMVNSASTLSYQNVSTPITRATPELSIITGSGISHNFSDIYYPRDWNGRVYYHYGYKPLGDCSTGKIIVQALVSNSNLNIGNDTIIDINDTITFHGPSGMLSYDWFDGSNDSINNIIASNLGYGIHYITLDVIDSLQCPQSDVLILAIANLAGINEDSDESLIFYPNPTTGIIYLETKNFEKIEIFGSNGELLKTLTNEKTVDLSHLPAGFFVLKIYTKESILYKRIIKLT